MSYGQNLPWGLRATRTLTAGSWNGQLNPYFIQSGYNNNIFTGDPVVVAGPGDAGGLQTGYLISIYDVAANDFSTTATLGVFNGCAYVDPAGINPIDPASPGRPVWVAGTRTLNDVPAVAYVMDDPSIIYNVQTSDNGATPETGGAIQADVGSTYVYVIPQIAGIVQGNRTTGQSQVSVIRAPANARGPNSELNNLFCARVVPTPPNPDVPGTKYNNAEFLIQNHQFARRAPARA